MVQILLASEKKVKEKRWFIVDKMCDTSLAAVVCTSVFVAHVFVL